MLAKQAATEPACGVKFGDGYDFLADPSDAYLQLKGGYGDREGFRLLEKHELPAHLGITFGCTYRRWCLNPPVYCAYLLRKFVIRGGKLLKKTLLFLEEGFSLAPAVNVVVNCSGYGFGDPNVYPVRGK